MTAEIIAELAPTGVLRASINLGNPVLAQGTPREPAGVTVDIAREIAARLGVPARYACFDAARKSLAALLAGEADIGFLGIEPARAADVAFTPPYVLIEGVYAVPADSPLRSVASVDAPGVRIGVKQGSAYDLYLTRTIRHATIVRGAEGTGVFAAEGLEVAAGVREPVTEFVASHPGLRLIDGAFMQIQQALGVVRSKSPAAVTYLSAVVEDLKASGFITDALRRSGQTARVAPLRREAPARRSERAQAQAHSRTSRYGGRPRRGASGSERSFERSGHTSGSRPRGPRAKRRGLHGHPCAGGRPPSHRRRPGVRPAGHSPLGNSDGESLPAKWLR